MSTPDLRILDPLTDRELFEQAYLWREKRKPHVQPDRMSFETFASNDSHHIVIGAFNGQLEAVFFFCEFAPNGYFECHFTSRRGVPRDFLEESAKEIVSCLFGHGATELAAWIVPRNRPLRDFVTRLGFVEVCHEIFSCQDLGQSATLGPDREFIKYVCTGGPP